MIMVEATTIREDNNNIKNRFEFPAKSLYFHLVSLEAQRRLRIFYIMYIVYAVHSQRRKGAVFSKVKVSSYSRLWMRLAQLLSF